MAFENLMEVASTVEICRSQLHLWLYSKARIFKDKNTATFIFDSDLMLKYIDKEAYSISTNEKLLLLQAKNILRTLLKSHVMHESFLEVAYPILNRHQAAKL